MEKGRFVRSGEGEVDEGAVGVRKSLATGLVPLESEPVCMGGGGGRIMLGEPGFDEGLSTENCRELGPGMKRACWLLR